MKINKLWASALFFALTGAAVAHGPVRQDTDEEITINAPAEKVWAVIQNYGDIAVWHSGVFLSPAQGGNEIGAKRELTLTDGNTITEELKKYDASKMSYAYKITDMSSSKTITHAGAEQKIPALPVDNYSATIKVEAQGAGSKVSWKANYYRAYVNNDPPAEMNEEAANAAVKEFVKTGLIDLKKIVEQ